MNSIYTRDNEMSLIKNPIRISVSKLIASDAYRDRVEACWKGKAIAGGIGAPYEGVPEKLSLTENDVYVQPGPNDDLELQVLWLYYAEKHRLALDAEKLSDAWLNHVKYGMDEYGVAIWNLRKGHKPPYTGVVNNWFVNGMGAAIRSEIWACLFPNDPQVAGYYAEQDATVDHHGDGVWAEIFLASSESLAFTNSIRNALEQGLNYISKSSQIHHIVTTVLDMYDSNLPPDKLRSAIMRKHETHNFSDCIMGVGFIVASLLYGEEDFMSTVLMAVNFGMDTDCTAATCGAFLGIAHGTKVLPESLVNSLDPNVAISPHVTITDQLPKTFDELTDRTATLAEDLNAEPEALPSQLTRYNPVVRSEFPPELSNTWVVIDDPGAHDMEKISSKMLAGTSCPGHLKDKIVMVDGIHMNLSSLVDVDKFNTIHLFSYLTIKSKCENPLLMACANTGITVWINDKQVLNYHGRQQEIPAFHRTEGGASFYYPFEPDRKYLVHIRLLNCRDPLRISVAVGDTDYQFLDDFSFRV